MIYRHDTIPYTDIAPTVYNYLSNFIEGLSYDDSTATIDFFGKFSYTIPKVSHPQMTLSFNGNSVVWGGGLGMGGTSDTYLILGEDFMYLKICRTGESRWVVLSYVKLSETRYLAGGTLGDRPEPSLYNISYYDTAAPILCQYKFPKVLAFGASAGKIVYAEQSPMAFNDTDVIFLDDVYCCSTVPIRSTVSIGNDNYVAIDTNNIVVLDSE